MATFRYGSGGSYSFEVSKDEEGCVCRSPEALDDPGGELAKLLVTPLDFPPMEQAVVPGDRVVIALDRYVPAAEECIAALWKPLSEKGVQPEDLLILQPIALPGVAVRDPRTMLPEEIRERVGWKIHDATESERLAYLSSTVEGERIYLARELVEADLVVTVGEIAFDPVMGIRGTNSVLYPGLSNVEAIAKAHGQGHLELGPNDDRGLRQLVDEVGWMLGVQFTLQVIAGPGRSASRIFAGMDTSVWNAGREALFEASMVTAEERVDVVLMAIEEDCAGHHWNQLGAALATARRLVAKGGKVIVLSELACEPGDGMNLIRQVREARDVLKPLRQQSPPDLIPATQLASMVDWAEVYLLSKLDSTLVDELFMIPIESVESVDHLLRVGDSTLFIEGAQHTFGEIASIEE
ncbi:MAG: DUF2088 domain-containing protein [Planctomycetaceae bacterium]|nr:DUF2088 domain-containing protein [Planctomycetaceae bacterium]